MKLVFLIGHVRDSQLSKFSKARNKRYKPVTGSKVIPSGINDVGTVNPCSNNCLPKWSRIGFNPLVADKLQENTSSHG